MKNKELKKIKKELKLLIKPRIIALSIPIAQILLGRRNKYSTPEREQRLKTMAKELIDLI